MNKSKARRKSKHAASGKYYKAFLKCVKKTGRWRGRPAKPTDVRAPKSGVGLAIRQQFKVD